MAERSQFDLVCFSHLRWNFVFQRPQHLLSRCARDRRVFFIEEPIFEEGDVHMNSTKDGERVHVLTPVLRPGSTPEQIAREQQILISQAFEDFDIKHYVSWYYTPLALDWYRNEKSQAVIYDCMDELSAFKGASPHMKAREQELFRRADLVFIGGISLYERKRQMHPAVYAFPSSVDVPHFAKARESNIEPEDQKRIVHPKMGFFGVIDERLDIELLEGLADLMPDVNIVMIGPVVKIDPAILPQRKNLHWIGGRTYPELPAYISGWDVALMPFALNESTEFISPTKTPEYLAAGRPVVSTPIRDVVATYGTQNYVRIASIAEEFAQACREALAENSEERRRRIDPFLAQMSWDNTWRAMSELIDGVLEAKSFARSGEQLASEWEGSNV